MKSVLPTRDQLISQQRNTKFDLIVIGGGITGAGVARDAALRGLSVALVEKGDFSSGTSSQSTKLLHGGLRYLKNYEFGLVREAALERKKNLEIAPHLGEIRDFLVPMYSWSEDRPIMLRLGLFLYSLLSVPKRLGWHKWLNKARIVEKEPLLENDDLRGGGLYQDVRTNDSKLVLANMLNALENGAAATNYTEAVGWTFNEDSVTVDVEDMVSGGSYQITGRVMINCTGPWTQRVEDKMEGFEGKAELRPTWGAHLMLKKKTSGYPLLIVNRDGRAVFLIPMGDYDMAGTTDIDYTDSPDKIAPTEFDRDYILNAVNNLFPNAKYDKDDIVSAFSGLRPLVAEKGVAEGKISRNHEIFVNSEKHTVTVTGGKLTTYRVMAKEAVDETINLLGYRKGDFQCVTDNVSLYGGEIDYNDWPNYLKRQTENLMEDYSLDEKSAKLVVKYYGSELPAFRAILDEHGSQKLKRDRPWLEAQVIYASRVEYATNPVDFLRRRTWIMLEEGNGEDILDRVVQLMGDELDWDDDKREVMTQRTIGYINKFIRIQPTEEIIPKEQAEKLEIPS